MYWCLDVVCIADIVNPYHHRRRRLYPSKQKVQFIYCFIYYILFRLIKLTKCHVFMESINKIVPLRFGQLRQSFVTVIFTKFNQNPCVDFRVSRHGLTYGIHQNVE